MSNTKKTASDKAAIRANKKMAKKGKLSYEKKKSLYGYGFIAIWFVGVIYFFAMPLVQSIIWSFHDTSVQDTGMAFEGGATIHNYVDAFRKDQDYSLALVDMLKNTALRTPLILIFSIFIAVILNQKFKARGFVRSVFFLPVIIATGPVIDIINGNMSAGGFGGGEQFSTMFETNLVDQLLNFLGIYNISDKLTETINTLTSDIFNLVWNSGIQILLFLSALQGIPVSAKEAAQMEGATSWEFFWKITIPYISPMILASAVYTVVDSFVDPANPVMTIVLNKASDWEHGYSMAMAWSYFAIVAVFLAIIVGLINKFVYYEVE